MKIALGHLRMRPADFWVMTLPEFFAATEGYVEANGGGGDAQVAPLSADEVEEMFANLQEKGST